MPALERWDPKPTLKLWFDQQRKNFSNVIDRKATEAKYFKGIFANTDKEKDSSDDEAATSAPTQLKKKF